MTWNQPRAKHRLACALLATGLAVAGAGGSLAQQAAVLAEGADDYESHCAACHGPAGRGDGPMAAILVLPPSDLTGIARARQGVFPFWRVYEIIQGRAPVKGHETFQMPLMEERFRRDQGKPGYRPAHIRLLTLTHYLESLQAK